MLEWLDKLVAGTRRILIHVNNNQPDTRRGIA